MCVCVHTNVLNVCMCTWAWGSKQEREKQSIYGVCVYV